MKVHKDIVNLPTFKNAVVTIGSFDGVHLGHQKILNRANQIAQEIGGESVLITFHPHPRKVIFPKDDSLNLLSTLDEKIALCAKHGLDHLVIVPFSVEFSQQSPREYVESFLLASFQPRHIIVGYDHRFGLNREGDISLLRTYESTHGINIVEISKKELDEIAISSTKIRQALKGGDIDTAKAFLGANYTLSGNVIHGEKIGNSIGYPTANIALSDTDKLIPMNGVYAVKCALSGGLEKLGMMYIGNRPTVTAKTKHASIEVNIFDFDDNIYDEEISVEIESFIREESKFNSLDALKNQLHQDKITALSVLSSEVTSTKEAKVCVAILCYNNREYLESFLPSISYSSTSPVHVAVIDNASSDDSVEYVTDWHPEVEIIQLTKNYGFAGGYNKGLKDVNTKYTVLLNSDVLVTENWLDPIIEVMEKDDTIGACQPTVRSLEQKTHFEYAGAAGGYLDTLGYPYCRGRLFDEVEEDNGQYKTIREIDWASGAAIVVRTEVYKQFEGLDEAYFAHMEEIDFCWRMRSAGYKLLVIPSSVVYHLGGGTLSYQSPRKHFLNFKNSLVTILKNEPASKLIWLFPLRLVLDGIAGAKFVLSGNFAIVLSIIKAHFAVYGSFGKILKRRKHYHKLIQKFRIGKAIESTTPVTSIVWNYFVKGVKRFSEL